MNEQQPSDDEANVETYGNPNLPEETPERPLVTFALFAYNQEKYIREAVEGAFAQTYSPLEIILSDDCSNDRTFTIMQEMARVYSGEHRIKIRTNKNNFGLVGHINRVLQIFCGKYIVLAAGDDISLPDRVDRIVEEFKGGALLVHSDFFPIDKDGKDLYDFKKPSLVWKADSVTIATSRAIYVGATGAWDRKLYDFFGTIKITESYEDLVFGYRASLLGEISFINSKLVRYRSGGMSSNGDKRERKKRAAVANIASLQQRKIDHLTAGCSKEVALCQIEAAIDVQKARFYFLSGDYRSFAIGIFKRKVFQGIVGAACRAALRSSFRLSWIFRKGEK